MNKKYFVLFSLIVILSLVPLAHAEDVVVSFYSNTAGIDDIHMQGVIGSEYTSGCGNTFTLGANTYITGADFYVAKMGSPTGYLAATIVNMTTKAMIQNSTTYFPIASLTAGFGWIHFTFSGATQYASGVSNVAVAVYVYNATLVDTNNSPLVRIYDVSSETVTCDGNVNSWTVFGAGFTTPYFLYGDVNPPATPTPTSTPATPGPLPTGGSYDTSDTNAVIDALFGYLVPLLLWLIPAGLLGWLTHWAKWPLLIGLAIGGGLCYLFLGTQYIWMVMVTLIGLVGMAYSDYQGGRAQ